MSETILIPVTQSTEPPQPQAGDWLLYWFDGEADYDDMTVHQKGKSKMVEVTGHGTNEVRGLVIVTLWHKMTDMMLSKLDKKETPTMMIYGEGSIYELARTRGTWEGPILAPWQRKDAA